MTSRELRDDNFTAFDLLYMAHQKKAPATPMNGRGMFLYIRLGFAYGNAWLGVNGKLGIGA